MCVWEVKEESRRCEYCSYTGGCERFPSATGKVDVKIVAGKYIKTMSDIVGQNILLRERTATLVWARDMVAYQLRQEGYSTAAVGECLGLNHSTITHCNAKMREMLSHPRMYQREIRIWEEFKERLSL